MEDTVLKDRPAGYAYLLTLLNLSGMPHWHISFVACSGSHRLSGSSAESVGELS